MKLVCGIGINDADYKVTKTVVFTDDFGNKKQKVLWACPFYRRWASMLMRCYSQKFININPTYAGCTVCEDWLHFSNFKAWMETQHWQGKHLDKDILYPGNREYGPDVCVFVDNRTNNYFVDRSIIEKDTPMGVRKIDDGLYEAIGTMRGRKTKKLGLYTSPEDAYQAWKVYKKAETDTLMLEQTDPRVIKRIQEFFNQL